ncbi:basement membrane-specific heparan sulfate proteoglycan core protein-like [Clytia hemisphaerica]|uniref:Uncharacterized protein n=1 Tax=Clytia hemisphaerica TaxID=252671 RepID=A0A7M5V1W0_9CNID
MWVRIILIFILKFQIAPLQLNGDQSVSMATRFEGSKPSTSIEDHFMKLTSFSRSIDIIWRPWQFALRTLLMYGQHPNDLNMIQLENGDVNKTLSNLEPGLSYIVAIRLYHSYADVQNITKVIATTPTFPSSTGGSNFKIETKLILKNSNKLSEGELQKFTEQKVKEDLLTLEGISRVTVYTTRKSTYGYSATLYMTVEDQPTVTALFHLMQDILPSIDAESFGFSFKILKDCCSPIYVHHLNGKKASPRQQPSSEKELFNLRVIPDNAFVEGRCDQAVDMNNADITIETHGDRPIKTLTLSLFILLNQTKGLQPIMSAVNYNTQLRLEVHDGRVVWMFYSLGSSQGFIIQTKELVQVKQWTHILVDYDSQSGVGRIFVDGQLSNKEMSRVKFSENWMLGLRFGKYFSGGMDYKMSGFLDELTFFDCLMSDDAIWRLSTKCGEFSCHGENDQQIEGPKINSGNPEKKIKLKDNKTMNNLCNSAGTIQNAGSRSKECACKTNVEGRYCNKCKNGTFNLQPSNKDGCIKCFCNGLTNDCRSAQIHHVKHTISAEELPSVKLRTFEGRHVTNYKYLSYDIQEGSITYKPSKDEQSNKETLYWELPLSFLGDKVTSYGGSLSYSLSYQTNDLTKLDPGPDIVIKAGDVELHHTTDENHHLDTENQFNAMLHENFWTTKDGQPVSRDQMMTSLARVDAILLRASYGNDVVRTRLQNFQMDIVSSDPVTSSSKMIASMVEECRCPPEYYGTSCQLCSRGFTKVKQNVPSKHHRCQACQCHAHASNCDGETGKCSDCKHYTTGDHCEKCLPGYYGDPRSGRSDACRPCPCPLTISTNQFSSTCHLGDDGQPICDACRQGHTGRYCQRCVAPYVGNPNKPGGYCKISQGVKCSDCDKKGSINSICDKTTGQCVCKKNVEGMKCKKCKKGTYYLHKKNKDGCLTCWCSGVSDVCTSSRYYRNSIPLDNVKGIRVTDFQEFLNIREGFYYNAMKELVLTKIQKLSDIVLYWDLPDKFTGNQLSTYGGAIKYTISYDADESGKPYSNIDIKMVGKNMILLYSNGEKINNRQVKKIKAVLREDRWTHLGGGHVTREEFLNCLSDVWNILIRATYSTKTKISSLSNFEMTGAVPFNMRKGKAFDVERCQCPTGYTGLSCEKCSRGFTKIINDLGQSKCEKCLCNGHATDCDGKTGKCIKCKHHTTGDRCDKCVDGYYGNPVKGQCKKCACPLPIQTNQFSSSCILNDDGDFTCSSCEPGYTGRKCGKCAKGYTGNPLTPGGTCKKFSQRYTAAPTVEITPQRRLDRIMTSATFKCTVHGKDPLEILWSRIDGRPLPKRALVTRTSKNSRTLVIKMLRLSDQETYICSGRNDYGLNTARAPLVVVGYQVDPIHLKITPKSMRIDQGGIARFYCKDNSETTSTIDWVSETGDLPKEATTNRGVLTIVNVQRKHSGLYTCIGSNQHSTDRVTVQLKVGVLEPPRASVSPPYGTVDIGESIEFQCSVTGYPLPTITWKRGNGKMLPRNVRIDGPSLRLTDIESEDEGDYICTATNKGGIVNRRGLLYVRDSQRIPQVTVEPRSITVKPGSSVSLLCSTGDTEATYKWQKKNGRLSARAKSQDGGRELRFNSVTLEDSGIYECLAKNNYGSDQTEAHLEVLTGKCLLHLGLHHFMMIHQ